MVNLENQSFEKIPPVNNSSLEYYKKRLAKLKRLRDELMTYENKRKFHYTECIKFEELIKETKETIIESI
jgi:hypothetical protein